MSVDIDLEATQAALRAAAARTAAMLASAPDPGAAVPGLDWTVAETAAHLVGDLGHYTGFVTGERDPADYLARAADASNAAERSVIGNAALLEEFTERDVTRLASMVESAADRFIGAAVCRQRDEPIMTATGVRMTVSMMTSALLGEQLIHGRDLAGALHRPWPIARSDALLVIAGVMAMVPEYVDQQKSAGRHINYELRFRGGPRYWIEIDDGTASVKTSGERADCWISADPVAFLLVAYGRVGQWGPTLTGKMIAGGRKPWLGLQLGQLLTSV